VAEGLLSGEVPIHRMPRGMKTEEDRIKWMEDNKISVHKLPEEIIERFPEELELLDISKHFDL